MPLGNGDVALNVWMTQEGDLQFYISKSDAWDDNARLVKIGKVRLHLEPNPIRAGGEFRQELKLSEGAIEISAGYKIRLWVDANHPVIETTIESPTPVEVTASVELWRTNRQELTQLQVSDVFTNRKLPHGKQAPLTIEQDTWLPAEKNCIAWMHHNLKSVGPAILAELQGLTGFRQPAPLLQRGFGAVLKAAKAERLDDTHLRSPRDTSHRFSVYVLTRHPTTQSQWLGEMANTIARTEAQEFSKRVEAHSHWWRDFWDRSWIRASGSPRAQTVAASIVPTNTHPFRIGIDQAGGNQFSGQFGRVSIFSKPLSEPEIVALTRLDRDQSVPATSGLLFSKSGPDAASLALAPDADLSSGLTLECWVKPAKLPGNGARLLDKITPGGSDGFLLDTFPGNSLRFICGERMLQHPEAVPADQWTHVVAVADPSAGGCRLYVNGKLVADGTGQVVRDEAAWVSQMYHLQRFITACAGRGAYPIKFNGSLFTVPPGPAEKDPDFRRWGPGYWWQNTRLPYISLCTSGDFDLQRPLFRMYSDELLPLCKYRTKLYLGHEGAYYPECIMFWGAVFAETYGSTPFAQRQDKLQESGWHKWEWVGGLELCWMMLDYYDHTLDRDFLRRTALPFSREILTFFDQHYPTNAQGKLVMYPSQALETWWKCTNAMPELAGCIAVSDRLLALPASLAPAADRRLWQTLRAKLPPIPLRDIAGRKALAPAEFFANKSNIENPELYPVFPFRLFAFNRPNADWALAALEHRWDHGHSGWRQDDIFMAYLGLTDQARKGLVSRARSHDPGERFPAFWGPNYDWTPDQDHGGVLMKAFQSMLLQTDGQKVFLFPAWPRDWNVEFKLHAPQQTVLQGEFRDGKLQSLQVTPKSRRADVTVIGQ